MSVLKEVRRHADAGGRWSGGQPETNQLGVTLFEDYTIQSALRLFFPHQDHTLTVWSRETLHSVGETASLACVSDTSRIYLVATY